MIRESSASASSYNISRFVFLRLLGVVSLVAFYSMLVQIRGLVGQQGILPAVEFLTYVKNEYGSSAYFRLPTLFWLNQSDWALHLVCLAGIVFSIVLIVDVAPRIMLLLIWLSYLSIMNVGQLFLGYQWDALLLETTFFSMFFAPGYILPKRDSPPPSRIARWALWLLVFKLMFLSGITKLLSGDPTWRDLTAMNYHYLTQPLPNPISWFMYQLPEWFHKTSVIGMFVVELVVPFLIIGPRLLRIVAAILMMGLQVAIGVTGNYGFFNLLTVALCIPLLDDRFFRWLIPDGLEAYLPRPSSGTHDNTNRRWFRFVSIVCLCILMLISGLRVVQEITRTRNPQANPVWIESMQRTSALLFMPIAQKLVFRFVDPFHTISGYGLFRVMTTERREIVIELSSDNGLQWRELEFRHKPGEIDRRPSFTGFHMPRLDWQMWFASLERQPPNWIYYFLKRVLDGSDSVRYLLADSGDQAVPQLVRIVYYRYEFTKASGLQTSWWKRRTIYHLESYRLEDFR